MTKEDGRATGVRARLGKSQKNPPQAVERVQELHTSTMPSRRVKLCTCAIIATLLVIAITLSLIFVLVRSQTLKAAPSASACLDISSSAICSRANSYPFYGTKTDYIVAKESLKEQGTSGERDGCKPKQLYLFSRHAARYPDLDKIEIMIEQLPKLKNAILEATTHDSICEKFKTDLRDWKISMKPSDDNSLSEVGKMQSQHLGERLKIKYPSLFSSAYTPENYEFGFTSRERTKETAEAFASGIFDGIPDLGNIPANDYVLQFHKSCEKILKKKGWKKDKNPEISKFQNGEIMNLVIKDMSKRLGITLDFDTFKLMYSICQFEYSMTGDSVWCPLFKVGYVKAFEYLDDVDDYYADGYGLARNYEQACPMVEHLIQKFESAVNGTTSNPNAVLMFSHAGAVKKVLSRFGLFEDSSPLTADGFCAAQDRKWRSSLICPFNANLAFLLYDCSGKFYVETFLQEKLVTIKGCSSSFCPWNEFKSYYGEIAQNCDLDKICTP